jgi:protein-L-isoaspartate(D-aspartate) O-methyltransferase
MERGPRSGNPEDLVAAAEGGGVRDVRILEAFRRVRREGFVPLDWVGLAYEDRPIAIAHHQVTTQPSLVARMIDGLRLEGTERVLEVGTGLGFQTALLSVLAREVFSIERFPGLAEAARANLEDAGIEGATIVAGDGTLGLVEHAPYQAIVVSAASPEVPRPLIDQLADGGRLVHPLGPGGREIVVAFRKEGDGLVEERRLVPAHFVPLIGRHGLAKE